MDQKTNSRENPTEPELGSLQRLIKVTIPEESNAGVGGGGASNQCYELKSGC